MGQSDAAGDASRRPLPDWALSIAAFAAVILTNFLSNALPINGQTPAEISARYPSMFTPAGFTFSIWGVIYLSLLGYVVYQALPAKRTDPLLERLSRPFQVSCGLNVAWILAFHYDLLVLSLLIMIALLVTLAWIYRLLLPARNEARLTARLFVLLPFSLYTAWISLATIANLSAVQTSLGWDDLGLGAVDWTLLKLAVAGALGATIIVRFGDIAFMLVVAWAAYGIAMNNVLNPLVSGAASMLMMAALVLVVAETLQRAFRRRARRPD